MIIANQRAIELFLDSKICEPILTMFKVQKFEFDFGDLAHEEYDPYAP